MARDIEEFLRKAAERRRQQQAGNDAGALGPSPVKPRPPRNRPRPVEIAEVVEVEEVVEAEEVRPRRLVESERNKLPGQNRARDPWSESVEDHVRHHIDTSDMSRHAESLGKRIHDVHDSTAARMKLKFDRDVTKLDDNPSIQDRPDEPIFGTESSRLATDLLKMLQTPQSVRRSILLAEILKRPDFDDEDE